MTSFGMSPLGMSPFRPCKEHVASARAAEVVAVEEELRLLDVVSSSEGVAEDFDSYSTLDNLACLCCEGKLELETKYKYNHEYGRYLCNSEGDKNGCCGGC